MLIEVLQEQAVLVLQVLPLVTPQELQELAVLVPRVLLLVTPQELLELLPAAVQEQLEVHLLLPHCLLSLVPTMVLL